MTTANKRYGDQHTHHERKKEYPHLKHAQRGFKMYTPPPSTRLTVSGQNFRRRLIHTLLHATISFMCSFIPSTPSRCLPKSLSNPMSNGFTLFEKPRLSQQQRPQLLQDLSKLVTGFLHRKRKMVRKSNRAARKRRRERGWMDTKDGKMRTHLLLTCFFACNGAYSILSRS